MTIRQNCFRSYSSYGGLNHWTISRFASFVIDALFSKSRKVQIFGIKSMEKCNNNIDYLMDLCYYYAIIILGG